MEIGGNVIHQNDEEANKNSRAEREGQHEFKNPNPKAKD